MDDRPGGRVALLGRRLPPAFRLRTVAVGPRRALEFDEAEWRDSLVVVERGEIELECHDGSGQRFGPGDVLCLVGLPLCALVNPGHEPVLLLAVSRR
jgi:hypothetical protein